MEFSSTQDGKYRIESLTRATFPGALKVIKESFFQEEAVCIGCEINKNEKAAEELLELCADTALDGVSLVAVHVESGEVAAVSFNKLQVHDADSSEKSFFEKFADERCTQESSKSVINFIVDIDARCNYIFDHFLGIAGVRCVAPRLNVDCSLEIMFLSTLKKHRQNKLGFLLVKANEVLAKILKTGPVATMSVEDLGPIYSYIKPRAVIKIPPKICQATWTSSISQKIGRSLGYIVNVTVSYEEFKHNGKTFADRIGPISPYCEAGYKVL